MTFKTERNTVGGIEHLRQQFRDRDDVVSLDGGMVAQRALPIVRSENGLGPFHHRLGCTQISTNLSDASFPVGATCPKTQNGVRGSLAFVGTIGLANGPKGRFVSLKTAPLAREIENLAANITVIATGVGTKLSVSDLALLDAEWGLTAKARLHNEGCFCHTNNDNTVAELVKRNRVNCWNATASLTQAPRQSAAKPQNSATVESRSEEGSETRAEETITPTSALAERQDIVHPARKTRIWYTETNTDITVNQWEYSAIAVETFTRQQVPRDLIATYAPKQGYTLGLSIDTALNAYTTGLTNSVGALTSELMYEDMLRAIQYLDDANVPLEDRIIGISPAQRAGFMKLDQFVNSDYAKLNDSTMSVAANRARLGTWLGLPAYMSTNIAGTNAAGHNNMVWQKEALALVLQLDVVTHTFFDVNFLSYKVVCEHIYGSAKMRDDHACQIAGA